MFLFRLGESFVYALRTEKLQEFERRLLQTSLATWGSFDQKAEKLLFITSFDDTTNCVADMRTLWLAPHLDTTYSSS